MNDKDLLKSFDINVEGKENELQLDDSESKSGLGQFCKKMNKKIQISVILVILLGVIFIILIFFLVVLIVKNSTKEKELNNTNNKLNKKEEELNDTNKKLNKKEKELNETKHNLTEKLNEKDEELKREKYNKEELIEEDTNKSDYDTTEKEYTINESGKYKICLYGANAEKGGRGCVKCAERYFESGSIIKYKLGGKNSGGIGGRDCGKFSGKGNNGAGLSMAYFSNNFKIVAGGGGGNSESGNRGGDCEQDGEGPVGGKGASIDTGKGGNGGGDKSNEGEFCGGGGGNGYKGGEGGKSGNGNNDGGGGGGSSYCKESKGVLCLQTSINIFKYSKIEIYQKVSE